MCDFNRIYSQLNRLFVAPRLLSNSMIKLSSRPLLSHPLFFSALSLSFELTFTFVRFGRRWRRWWWCWSRYWSRWMRGIGSRSSATDEAYESKSQQTFFPEYLGTTLAKSEEANLQMQLRQCRMITMLIL